MVVGMQCVRRSEKKVDEMRGEERQKGRSKNKKKRRRRKAARQRKAMKEATEGEGGRQ